MTCGMFGKLAAKRDFVSVNTPRQFLLAWEAWMQAGIAASKNEMGQAWLQAYLMAPLWRFQLAAGVCGLPVKGVFMSSMDGVGRHFPLTVFGFGEENEAFPEPDGDQGWFEAAETFLLGTLDAGEDYETVLASLSALPDGQPATPDVPLAEIASRQGALVAQAGDGCDPIPLFAALLGERARREGVQRSHWWTIGGESHPPMALIADGLPQPHIMALLLAGTRELATI